MINIKQGTALSLQQVNKVGLAGLSTTADYQILAGMVVGLSSGTVAKATTSILPLGFAINDYRDGDVIASGKIGIYMLDGNSIIETDQSLVAITAANYPVGSAVYADLTGGNGYVNNVVNTGGKIIGFVDGIRTLPAAAPVDLTTSQTYVDRDGVSHTDTVKMGWKNVTVLSIKLHAYPS